MLFLERPSVAVFSHIPEHFPSLSGSSAPRRQRYALLFFSILLLLSLALGTGCARFHKTHHEYVYVWARHMFLRDRVAAVSNRVAEVKNGQRLEVLESNRRFLRVQTDDNQVGWIPDRAVIDQQTYNGFEQLVTQHKDDPIVANATLRDDFYLHLSPGRDTDRFYLLPENTKVQMLVRASVPKTTIPKPTAPAPKDQSSAKVATSPAPAPEPIVMEDWWLVRNGQGYMGWLLSSRIDVNAPFEIAQYAEGQRIVGAYVIRRVHDDQSSAPNHEVPEYVTALGPYKWGLPYDFDQIRVFTWNVKRHRYETAFRLRNIQGYLPVKISTQPASNGGTEPVFAFQISTSGDVSIDPATGIAKPASPRTISFALRQTVVRRIGSDLAPITAIRTGESKTKPSSRGKRR